MNRVFELKVLKRSLQSLAGGLGIFVSSSLFAYTVTDVWRLSFLADTVLLLVTWPHSIFGLVYGPDIEGKLTFDTVIVSMLFQILIYSLLTFVSLEWYAKRKRLSLAMW